MYAQSMGCKRSADRFAIYNKHFMHLYVSIVCELVGWLPNL